MNYAAPQISTGFYMSFAGFLEENVAVEQVLCLFFDDLNRYLYMSLILFIVRLLSLL